MAQILSLGLDCWVEKSCYRLRTPLAIGGTRTQVFADSMAIAESTLNHCTTYTLKTWFAWNQLYFLLLLTTDLCSPFTYSTSYASLLAELHCNWRQHCCIAHLSYPCTAVHNATFKAGLQYPSFIAMWIFLCSAFGY